MQRNTFFKRKLREATHQRENLFKLRWNQIIIDHVYRRKARARPSVRVRAYVSAGVSVNVVQIRQPLFLRLFRYIVFLALLTIGGIHESTRCAPRERFPEGNHDSAPHPDPLTPHARVVVRSDDKLAHFVQQAVLDNLVRAALASVCV